MPVTGSPSCGWRGVYAWCEVDVPDGTASEESDSEHKLRVTYPDDSGDTGRGTENRTMTDATIKEQANSEIDHVKRMLERTQAAPVEEKAERLESIKSELDEIRYLIEG